jgi:hypothetical protein
MADALELEQQQRADTRSPAENLGKHHRSLLELNGYNAVRTEVLNAVNTLAGVPLEALDAVLAFARQAATRAEVSTHPDAAKAREQMLTEARIYNAARRLVAELHEHEQRAQARERITAR